MAQGHFLAAVPLFERAIAIDPNFAMAYLFLGGCSIRRGTWRVARNMRNRHSV